MDPAEKKGFWILTVYHYNAKTGVSIVLGHKRSDSLTALMAYGDKKCDMKSTFYRIKPDPEQLEEKIKERNKHYTTH